MLLVSSYLITRKQAQMTAEFAQQVAEGLVKFTNEKQLTLVINSTQTQTLTEYRIFTAMVMIGSTLVGGLLLSFVIFRMLRPLKVLTKTVNCIDINSLAEHQDDIAGCRGSREIRELAEGFQLTLGKIYENYEKQKQFSINVAHELRTPLTVLLTKVDVFKRQYADADPAVLQFADVLGLNIERLSKLVEEILFLSRDYPQKIRDISVRELCEEVVLDLEDKAEQKQIGLSVSGSDTCIRADDALLERAVYNLVDNAIKYTPSGGKCNIEIMEITDTLRLSVADNGPGIPNEQKQSIFDLFYRVEDSRNRDTGGYGIGLALVHDVIRRMGGTIRVFDNSPTGSIFRIDLPLSPDLKGNKHE